MSESPFKAPASLVAALLLLLREVIADLKSFPRTVAETLALTGAGKSQAYAMLDRLRELLPTLIGTPGRPASQPTDQCGQGGECPSTKVVMAVRSYVVAHPGCCGTGERCTYHDGFRRFVVGLVAPGQPAEGMSEGRLARLVGVPVGTLHDWLKPQPQPPRHSTSSSCSTPTHNAPEDIDTPIPSTVGNAEATNAEGGSAEETDAPVPATVDNADVPACSPGSTDTVSNLEAQENSSPEDPDASILTIGNTRHVHVFKLWKTWEGSFQAFCHMLRTEHRMPYGDTYIGSLLQALGLRQRRRQTPVEAPWSSNTYQTFFAGAQWLGDGTEIAIELGGKRFKFNLEAILDVFSTAMMGLHVSKFESEEALCHAYEAAKATGGGPPHATTLDNKNCNHSPEAQAALADTILLRATLFRGQAKAPLEGAFGTFQQTLPPLVVTGNTLEEMAASVLLLVAIAFYRGRNGRPRKRLNGRTPAQAYINAKPTPEEIQEALKWFRELERQQEQARLTREARRDPVRFELLKKGLAELGIADPDDRLATSLAYYSREAIARGLATFKSKAPETLPPQARHGRYLGGIIRNLHTQLELEAFAVHIMEQRIRLHDFTLIPLKRAADEITCKLPLSERPRAFVDRALDAPCAVDFRFWAEATAKSLEAQCATDRTHLYKALTLHIAASRKVHRQRRADLIDRLAEALASRAA